MTTTIAPSVATARALDSEAVLADVLAYTERNIGRLERMASHFQTNDSVPLGRTIDKVVAETAILLLLASRRAATGSPLRASIDRIAVALSPLARATRTRVILLRFPSHATALGLAHIVLTRLGFADVGFDHILRQALSSGEVDAVERLPFRVMDVRWVRAQMTGATELSYDDVLPRSILNHLPHPIYMDRGDGYALTHAVLYATDFGRAAFPAAVDPDAVLLAIDAALTWTALGGDDDLSAELLLARIAIGDSPWSPHSDLARRRLLERWADGRLAGPNYDASTAAGLSSEPATAYEFEHRYHTIYVLGMLAAVDGLPFLPDSDDSDGDGRRIEDLLEVLRRTRPGLSAVSWTEWVAGQQLRDRYEVVLDGLLIDACRRYDLPLLAILLGEGVRARVSPGVAFRRATRFLESQRLESGAIGAYAVDAVNARLPAARTLTEGMTRVLENALRYLSREEHRWTRQTHHALR